MRLELQFNNPQQRLGNWESFQCCCSFCAPSFDSSIQFIASIKAYLPWCNPIRSLALSVWHIPIELPIRVQYTRGWQCMLSEEAAKTQKNNIHNAAVLLRISDSDWKNNKTTRTWSGRVWYLGRQLATISNERRSNRADKSKLPQGKNTIQDLSSNSCFRFLTLLICSSDPRRWRNELVA